MQKPTHYLWRNDFTTDEEYDNTKNHLSQMGYRIVTFIQAQSGRDIQEAIKALACNHLSDMDFQSFPIASPGDAYDFAR